MNKKILSQNDNCAFELKKGAGKITAVCPCGQFIEIYTINETFRVSSPTSLGFEPQDPNALWTTTQISSDVGTQNPIISRILLQNHEILKAAWFERETNKEAITSVLHKCKEHLLICDRIAKKISEEIDKIISQIEKEGIAKEKNGRGLNPFPNIPNLMTECSTFLIEAKQTIKSVCELATFFFELPCDNNFKDLANHLSKAIKKDSPLIKFIELNIPKTKRIIDLRNYCEHQSKENKTIIEDFRYAPNLTITVPQWRITGEEGKPIKKEMNGIVSYLLQVAEAMFIHLVMTTVKKEIPYIIEEIENSKIDLDFPIKYKLSLNSNFIKKIKRFDLLRKIHN